jgi:hypothetical protein
MNKSFRQTVDARLSGMTMHRELKTRVLSAIEKEREAAMKKKIPAAAIIVLALLLAALATAMALTNGFGLFDLMGKDKKEIFSIVQPDAYTLLKKDLASYSFEHVDVAVKEAVYDGRYLRIVYSTRDRSATEPFRVDFYTEQAESFTFDAANEDHINWMVMDWCLINGEHVSPLGECGTYAGEGNGEIVAWEQFDLSELTLGDTFTVELPICYTKDAPKKLSFTLSSVNLPGVYHVQPPEETRISDYTAKVSEFLISPIRVYLDLLLTVDAGVSIERCEKILNQWMRDGNLSDEAGKNELTGSSSAGYVENTIWSDQDFADHIVDVTKPVKILVQFELFTSPGYPDTFRLAAGDDSILIPNVTVK